MNYYPFNISDFGYATRHLTLVEKAIYRELLDIYYDQESPLENNIEKLARLICATECVTSVEQVLNEFFTLENNTWIHSTCDRIIADYHDKLNKASKAGKASARARAKRSNANRDSTDVERPLNGCATNQEPITNNQEPDNIFTAPSVIEVAELFAEKGYCYKTAKEEAEKFMEYYGKVDWKVGKSKKQMTNWKLAVANWKRNKDERDEKTKRYRSEDIDFESTGWSKS